MKLNPLYIITSFQLIILQELNLKRPQCNIFAKMEENENIQFQMQNTNLDAFCSNLVVKATIFWYSFSYCLT